MEFDVFLSHNSQDKPVVRELKQLLLDNGLAVWLDEDELQPGLPWQELLEAGIKTSRSVAVLVGKDGLGPWEDQEMRAALNLAVNDKRPAIPVLLREATAQPELPLFLANRTWVDLRGGFTEDGLARLIWGITGEKPTSKLRGIVPEVEAGSSSEFIDRIVRNVAAALEKAQPMTMRTLVLNLDVLFNRGTFRFEPLRECVTQEWGRRLLPAMETLELLRRYSSFVSDQAPDNETFETLMDEVNRYCLAMATHLFEEPVRVSEMRDYLGTAEFLKRLPKDKKLSADEIDDEMNTRVDGPRLRAVEQMGQLRKEFLS